MNKFAAFFLVAICFSEMPSCSAQQAEKAFPRFSITPGSADSDGLPTSGAKLCVLPEKTVCFTMPSHKQDADVSYDFGNEPLAEKLKVPGGGSWVFFSSLFSAGGSGTLRRLAVLQYDGTRITNLLPDVAATNVSDFAMWSLPQVSPFPVLVKADFVWADGESHFEPHRFRVTAFTYTPEKKQYTEAFHYTTPKKYDGGDSAPVRVLQPERNTIVAQFNKR